MNAHQLEQLNNFLSFFKFPDLNKLSRGKCFDIDLIKRNQVAKYLNKYYPTSIGFNNEIESNSIPLDLSDFSKSDKVLIILFLIDNSFSMIEDDKLLYDIGLKLGFSVDEVSGIVKFYYSEELFEDRVDSLYLIDSNTELYNQNIGYNFESYDENYVTYFKYIRESNIILSRRITESFGDSNRIDFQSGFSLLTEEDPTSFNLKSKNFGYLVKKILEFKSLNYHFINSTNNSPKVVLNPEIGEISIIGRSSPLSPTCFFNPIFDWLDEYKNSGKKSLIIHLHLDYFNTYTSKSIIKLVKMAQIMSQHGCHSAIYWYVDFDDEDLIEFGDHLKNIFPSGVKCCYLEPDGDFSKSNLIKWQ